MNAPKTGRPPASQNEDQRMSPSSVVDIYAVRYATKSSEHPEPDQGHRLAGWAEGGGGGEHPEVPNPDPKLPFSHQSSLLNPKP